MPAALAIPAAISAATGIAGSVIQSRKAKEAAKIQSEAAEQIGQLGLKAGEDAAKGVTGAAQSGATAVEGASGAAAGAVEAAARDAGAGMDTATGQANDILSNVYRDTTGALNPYLEAGGEGIKTLRELVSGPGSEFAFSQDDPSYQFRLTEGQKALERSKAARGMLASGGTLKALTNYAQDAASQEYQAAFNRWLAKRQQRGSLAGTLAGFGSDATGRLIGAGETYGGRVANNLIGAAGYKGDVGMRGAETGGQFRVGGAQFGANLRYGGASDAGRFRLGGTQILADSMGDAANAKASGKIAVGNAWNAGLGTVANAANSYASGRMMRDFVREPVVVRRPVQGES